MFWFREPLRILIREFVYTKSLWIRVDQGTSIIMFDRYVLQICNFETWKWIVRNLETLESCNLGTPQKMFSGPRSCFCDPGHFRNKFQKQRFSNLMRALGVLRRFARALESLVKNKSERSRDHETSGGVWDWWTSFSGGSWGHRKSFVERFLGPLKNRIGRFRAGLWEREKEYGWFREVFGRVFGKILGIIPNSNKKFNCPTSSLCRWLLDVWGPGGLLLFFELNLHLPSSAMGC